jgi:aspartyl-tRNA(Asn)/glutamyl-tRNA(Gln) amidotransferase subunit A
MSGLPSTIAELQTSISKGEISAHEALHIQQSQLSASVCARDGFVDVFNIQNDEIPISGPLQGVGMAHKDIFQLANRHPGLGITATGNASPSSLKPAHCIESLHLSGAVQLGALHMAAYACGATSQNEFLGECTNPLDGESAVGGSSSGSAVAVARELCFASLGTDTAGSVRIPAATCGLLGLKTTQGLLSTVGVAPLAPDLDTVGIVARSALDLEIVLREMLGQGTECIQEQGVALSEPHEFNQIHCWLPSQIMDGVVAQEMLECTKNLPSITINEHFPDESSISAYSELMLYQQVAQTHQALVQKGFESQLDPLSPSSAVPRSIPKGLIEMVQLGLMEPLSWAKEALSQRTLWRKRFEAHFLKFHDLLIMPSIGIEIPLASQVRVGDAQFDARKLLSLHRFMGFVNYLGLPSLSLPIGKDSRGMPISIQLVCRPYQELSLLRWAQRFIGSRFGTQNVRHSYPFFV